MFIEKFPILVANSNTKNVIEKIEKLVSQILVFKKQNKNTDTKDLENQIDQLVYKLYDLTDEEIKIIENFK